MKTTDFQNTFAYRVIYIFTINDQAHSGLVKIGEATLDTSTPIDQLTPNSHELNQAARDRIKQYTNTAGITFDLLYTELAIMTVRDEDGKPATKLFHDTNVHKVLTNSGIKKKKIGDTTGNEWFEIDLGTAKKAINAVKLGYANLSNTSIDDTHSPIVLYPEQERCVERACKHLKKADRFLINAKMRFGKTLVTLEIIKRKEYKKTIIMTHRPVVDAGWYEDFQNVFYGHDDIIYGSRATGYTLAELLNKKKKFIYFASIQDLRGSSEVGGSWDKNDLVFSTVWDCVVVDEAHEGTTTALGETTVNAVVKEGAGTKFIALSGTPFNILTEYDSNSIYTYDYIMEQENKSTWDKLHFGDHNPYADLPTMHIYTYDLGDILHNSNYITYEDKAFNFREFFRTFTGDFKKDNAYMPETAKVGDFIHETDVWSFLNLMTQSSSTSNYPYSKKEYCDIFRHTLWMVPGVKEAKALKRLMLKHPVFGSGEFDIVNVAGDGDEEEKSEEALNKVKTAIAEAHKDNSYTITLSCGKLTTGVTVREWTAVLMLAGSYSTSASSYMQTIFRVQSPCTMNGKMKENCYVFDFAPDRTLKMISRAVQISAKAGKTTDNDRQIMKNFLNYCPVISVSGSEMKQYSTDKLLQQLKRAYADRVVSNGFDDSGLYNDSLLTLDQLDIKKFDKLKGIIGKSKASPKANDITINDQGLTNEEYEEEEKLKKKPKNELTEEEKEKLEELKKKKKVRHDAISILRGISIRMPLLIYGADISYDDEITLDKFVDIVDESSWNEFMPNGVTKELFKEFQKYYDEDVFIAAGRRIRNVAKEADTLEPTERVKKIAGLFSHFKNPDKETVLTPWRVVNLHLSDCIGGWCFYDETFEEDRKPEKPRFVDQGSVTDDIFKNKEAHVLEINSKTGLYPLYIAYSMYRRNLNEHEDEKLTIQDMQKLWFEVVQKNIFVICKTPMAKAITKRTLVGYSNININAHYFDDLINIMQNKPQMFLKKVSKCSYWKKGDGEMNFDAIVGNPPYQLMGGSGGNNDSPLYQYFVINAKRLDPSYISLIIPSRWFAAGRENLLGNFRKEMLNSNDVEKLVVYLNSNDIFPNVEIKGGICYFLIDMNYDGKCNYTFIKNGEKESCKRTLNDFDVLIREPVLSDIVKKVITVNGGEKNTLQDIISNDTPFGISSNPKSSKKNPMKVYAKSSPNHDIQLFHIEKQVRKVEYVSRSDITKNKQDIDFIKVFIPGAGGSGADSVVLGKPELAPKGSVCSQSYLYAKFDTKEEATNFIKYLKTKFSRALIASMKISQSAPRRVYRFTPMQNFSNNSDIDWSKAINEIDNQLYDKYSLTSEERQFIESSISLIE